VTPTPLFAPGPVVSIKSDTSINLPVINNIPAYNNDSLILKYTNKERSLAGLNILSSNLLLDQIASLRADDLFDNQYFEHESPDGHSATDLTKTVGYDYVYIGENLALGNFDGEKGIVSAWMDSPGHRANILSDKYSELGVVIKNGIFKGENVTIAVQIFGKPSSFCAKPNSKTKETIDEIGNSVRQMQVEAAQLFDNLNTMKNSPGLDASYYNQKIQEYNYYAKKVNDVVLALKIMIDAYNVQVGKYNVCIGS
jgi:uncharacterized protein YkwD